MISSFQRVKPSASITTIRCFPYHRRRKSILAVLSLTTATTSSSSCRASFHELLLPGSLSRTNQSSKEGIIDTFHNAGINKLAFLRHGQTAPASDGIDYNRILTETGREQAREAGRSFGRNSLFPFYHTVLVSPAPRTLETARLFLSTAIRQETYDDSNRNDFTVQLKPLQVAYDGTMQPGGNALFRKLGYSPLVDYIGNNKLDQVDKQTAQKLLGQYAADITESILHLLHENDENSKGRQLCRGRNEETKTLLFVGHAIYLPAVVLFMACELNCNDTSKDLVLNTVTGEAEGYLIDIPTQNVQYLQRPVIA